MMKKVIKVLTVGIFSLLLSTPCLADEEAAMPVMKITIDADIKKDMDYAKGTMQLTDTDGTTVSMKAMFKTRGATAQKYLMKPSLNMKLRTDDYASSQDSSLLGMRSISKWILDAMAIDRICMRNRVLMDVWNEYSKLPYETDFDGRNGTEGRFVEMYINGTYYGIYCLSDRINRKLLNLKKYDEEKGLVRGVLYKSGTEEIGDQNSFGYNDDYTAATISYHNAWELKEPEDYPCKEAWQPLVDIFADKTYVNVKKYFFLDNLADYQLLVMAFSISDNWGNKNHFFSIRNIQKDIDDADPTEAARRKFVVTPWDLDTGLGGRYDGSYYDGTYSNWEVSAVSKNGGFYPYSWCQGQSEYKDLLKARWSELRNTAFSIESVNARLEAYRDLFINSGAWQRMVDAFGERSSRPCYVKDLAKEISLVEDWYASRFAEMDEYFGISTNSIGSVGTDNNGTSQGDAVYDLQGRKLNAIPAHGIYVKGKKVFLK